MAVMKKYPYGLDEPLLWFDKYPWTIRNSLEGTAILGDMGSGKTSGSGRTIRRALLNAGYGGLVLCKKNDEAESWIEDAWSCKRQDQLLVVHPSQPFRFNFLPYQFTRAGEGAGHLENAVQMFLNIIENRREGQSAAQEQGLQFFMDGAKDLIRHCLAILIMSGEQVSMDNMRKIVRSLPYASTEGPKFPQGSYLQTILKRAVRRANVSDLTSRDVEEYFLGEFARSGANRQSAGILSTFTGMAQSFMSGPIRELFCTETNFVPEFSRKGAIIILNLPLDEWEEIGRTAQLMFKYIWQRAILRRQGLPPGEVPVFLWADEASNFITTADRNFQEASRSSVCATVFLSQNINNYIAAFTTNPEANTDALLAGLGTKIFHRNGDQRTNSWAAETISKSIQYRYSGGENESRGFSEGQNWGSNSGYSHTVGSSGSSGGYSSGSNIGYSKNKGTSSGWQQQIDYQVQPEMFTRLAAVGYVQAVVFKSGAQFPPSGLPFTGVTFKQ